MLAMPIGRYVLPQSGSVPKSSLAAATQYISFTTAGGGIVTIQDLFDRANSDEIGGAWVEDYRDGGGWKIISNRLVCFSGTECSSQALGTDCNKIDVTGELELDGNNDQTRFAYAFMAHAASLQWDPYGFSLAAGWNGYKIWINEYGGTWRCKINRIVNGSQTELASDNNIASADANEKDFRVVVDATSGDTVITVYVDGVQKMTVSDDGGSQFTTFKRFGIGARENDTVALNSVTAICTPS